MERDKAAVGRGPEGVRARRLEPRRLLHQLALRRHHRPQGRLILPRPGGDRPRAQVRRLREVSELNDGLSHPTKTDAAS